MVLLRFIGINSDVNLNAFSHAEFDDGNGPTKKLLSQVLLDLRSAVYESIFDEFADVLKGLKDN